MKMKKSVVKIISLAFAIGLFCIALCSCGSKKKTFIVGFDADFPPYGYVGDNGEYTGFDIEAEKKRAEKYDEMLKKHEDKKIKSKIGYRKKWIEVLDWMNMEL